MSLKGSMRHLQKERMEILMFHNEDDLSHNAIEVIIVKLHTKAPVNRSGTKNWNNRILV